ncbi:MAG: hypothetical protein ACPLVF_01945 [Thermovenabulum sp.]|uniref:hypothetical protein n=1 Tax=Thermovenabulum sp. TaxID=3100335 RepID=UPI003C7DA671
MLIKNIHFSCLRRIEEVPCERILGNGWANIPLEEVRGSYPKPSKVFRVLIGYLNLNSECRDTRNNMQPIPVYKIFDEYFCEEGNHRLYVARLLGLPKIKAEVYEIDYTEFLGKSKIFNYGGGYYIGVLKDNNDSYFLYPVDKEQAENYIKLKNGTKSLK